MDLVPYAGQSVFLLLAVIVARLLCVYDLRVWQALLLLPRLLWANVINFAATMRAFRLYARYLLTGKVIAWDKTDHVYPSEAELVAYRRRLGDLMLDRRFITTRPAGCPPLHARKKPACPLGGCCWIWG